MFILNADYLLYYSVKISFVSLRYDEMGNKEDQLIIKLIITLKAIVLNLGVKTQ